MNESHLYMALCGGTFCTGIILTKTDSVPLQAVGLMCIITMALVVTGVMTAVLIDMYFDRRSRFEAFKTALRRNEQSEERKQQEKVV